MVLAHHVKLSSCSTIDLPKAVFNFSLLLLSELIDANIKDKKWQKGKRHSLLADWRVATPLGTQATNKPHTDLRSPGQGADSCLLTHSLSIEHSPHSYSKNSIRNIFKQTLFGKGFWGRSNARVELNIDLYRAFNFHPPCYDFYGFYGVFQVCERSHTRQSKLCKYLILSTMSTTTMCMSEIGCVA